MVDRLPRTRRHRGRIRPDHAVSPVVRVWQTHEMRDQGDNAARVVAAGAGVRVPRRAGEPAIRAAIGRVPAQPSYLAPARRLAEAFAFEALTRPNAGADWRLC